MRTTIYRDGVAVRSVAGDTELFVIVVVDVLSLGLSVMGGSVFAEWVNISLNKLPVRLPSLVVVLMVVVVIVVVVEYGN